MIDLSPLAPGTVAQVTHRLCRALGMTRIFGNPGSTELPLFRGMPSDFEYVLALQESIAVGVADGFAQASRRPALVSLHSAVGVGHAMGNLFTAFKNQTPLVIIAGQQARALLTMQPFLHSDRATELPQPYVKWAHEPARAEDVPAALMRAWTIARTWPQGPVMLSVPVDDWDRPCPIPPAVREVSVRVAPDPALLTRVADALARAERPVFVAGAGVALDDAWDGLVALAEKHVAPVWTAPMAARCAFPESHRLFAGFLPARVEGIRDTLHGHDLAIVFGAPAFTYHAEGSGPYLPPDLELYQFGADPMAASWAPGGMAIAGDLSLAIDVLLSSTAPPRLARPPRPKPEAPDGARLTDALILSRLAALRPADSVIVEEAPSARGPMHDHLPIDAPDGFYTCASGGLGHALPAAVGVALAQPRRKVIALLGDGSAMYSIQALWSASQSGCDLAVVVLDNSGYRALEEFARHFRIEDAPGTAIGGIDFAGLANAMGLTAQRIDRPEDLDAALVRLLAQEGPALLHIAIE